MVAGLKVAYSNLNFNQVHGLEQRLLEKPWQDFAPSQSSLNTTVLRPSPFCSHSLRCVDSISSHIVSDNAHSFNPLLRLTYPAPESSCFSVTPTFLSSTTRSFINQHHTHLPPAEHRPLIIPTLVLSPHLTSRPSTSLCNEASFRVAQLYGAGNDNHCRVTVPDDCASLFVPTSAGRQP